MEEIAVWTGVSVGSVENFSKRCIVALLSLHNEAFNFCDEEQMDEAQKYVMELVNSEEWKSGALAGDGTPVPLSSRPSWYGQDFYGKDKLYAIQLTVYPKLMLLAL